MPLLSLLIVVAMIAALIDIIMRDEWQVKHLPKFGWIILVILLPLIGTVLWFVLGREYAGGGPVALPRPGRRPDASRPGQSVTAVRPTFENRSTEIRSTEQQLADLEREIEEDRLRAELERRRGGELESGGRAEA
ncbi:hypothetical protein FLP10_05085 [Agromyces intestinalis]|uniref:Cardiolipin synthase N-terminal domain-containing protein n=1 Tax=Agromyces intestinalis TaxID=2592652 RepID=A0A5C1YCY1_9MICO|nr:PLDc N-terminal domain-containing protein [Agromyces intestinalis]QEO13866.1 hypothetical protein FLP10_05085 [Agromyces intestinalis]